MKLYDRVKKVLCDIPSTRERKLRYKTVLYIYSIIHNTGDIESISKKDLIDFAIKDLSSINRMINKVQQDYENLRGTDYEDKKRLQQERKLELGYVPGHRQQIKKLKTL